MPGTWQKAKYHIKNAIKDSLSAGRYYRGWAHCLRYSASQRLDLIRRLEISRHLCAMQDPRIHVSSRMTGAETSSSALIEMSRTFHHLEAYGQWCAAEPADFAVSLDLENDGAGKSAVGSQKVAQLLTTASLRRAPRGAALDSPGKQEPSNPPLNPH